MSDDFIPDSQFTPDQTQIASTSGVSNAPAAPNFIPDHQFTPDEEKYGTLGQQALGATEGVAHGVAGPLATLVEEKISDLGVPGLTPQDQAARQETNPWVHGLSEAAGLAGSMATGVGEGKLLLGAGDLALNAAKLAEPTTMVAKIAGSALKGAVETSLYQAGDEISKRINDPSLSAASAFGNIALSGLIGAGGGAILGPISPYWAKDNAEEVAQGISDFKNSVDGSVVDQKASQPFTDLVNDDNASNFLTKQKSNAHEIMDIADKYNWPIAEGMTSDSKEIQMAEDALLHGPPTIPSIGRTKLYKDAFNQASTAVDRAVSSGANEMSETQAGNALKESLMGKLEAENEPIKAMYKQLEPYQEQIQVKDSATGALSNKLEQLIKDKGLVPGSERYNFVKTFANGAENISNLLELKNFRTEIGRSSGPLTKDLAGDISSRLGAVEEGAIRKFADAQQDGTPIRGMIDQMDEAKGAYRQFKTKLETLGASMGKKKVYGPQDFIDFIDDMNPQTLAKRLFNENNTSFTKYFAENFPEEMGILRGYQRGQLRMEASKAGTFNAPKAIKEVMGMEPEMQKLLLAPDEIQTIKDADTYLKSFPKSFNPSGTAHESAFRAFFEHPTGAAIANLRDFGIQSFIKAFGKAVPGAESEAGKILPLLGKSVQNSEVNPGAFKHAVEYTLSVIRGENAMKRAAKSVFQSAVPVAAASIPSDEKVQALDKKLKNFQQNPDLYSSVGGDIGHYLPNHDIALKGAVSSAVSYLNSIRPMPIKPSPLDPEIQPTPSQKATFARALSIAEKPLSIVSLMKEGTMTSEDVQNLNRLYPGMSQRLVEHLTSEMTSEVSKNNPIPYHIRFGLSALMGQPLDSAFQPQNVMANQAAFGGPTAEGAAQTGAGGKSSTSQVGMRNLKIADRASLDNESDDS